MVDGKLVVAVFFWSPIQPPAGSLELGLSTNEISARARVTRFREHHLLRSAQPRCDIAPLPRAPLTFVISAKRCHVVDFVTNLALLLLLFSHTE